MAPSLLDTVIGYNIRGSVLLVFFFHPLFWFLKRLLPCCVHSVMTLDSVLLDIPKSIDVQYQLFQLVTSYNLTCLKVSDVWHFAHLIKIQYIYNFKKVSSYYHDIYCLHFNSLVTRFIFQRIWDTLLNAIFFHMYFQYFDNHLYI